MSFTSMFHLMLQQSVRQRHCLPFGIGKPLVLRDDSQPTEPQVKAGPLLNKCESSGIH